MTRRSRVAALAALVTSGAVVAALLAPTASAEDGAERSAASADRPLRYVAMGDSFSAASGVLPVDPEAPLNCLRSSRNYPHVIAERTGARLTDVTCGAAETGDYFRRQYANVPRQLDALDDRTELVTMTIGGNDGNVFVGAIVACATAGIASGGTGSPCRDTYGDEFVTTVREETYPDLVRAMRATRRQAPNATVAVLGYPWLLPERVGCFPQMPVARGDVPYLRRLQSVLDASVERAARQTGATYVDVPARSEGHDACQPLGTRWIEPALLGTNPVVVHPNGLGERRMAGITMRRLGLAD